MKTKYLFSLTAFIGLTSLTLLTHASYSPQFKECTHLYDGVMLGTYDMVLATQACPAMPPGLHEHNGPKTGSNYPSAQDHDDDDPLCTKSSFFVDN